MKKFLAIAILLIICSCKQEEKPAYVVFNGAVKNNTAEKAVIRGTDFEATMPIRPDGTFADTLDISKDGFYDLVIGRERTNIYLEKGGNLSVSVDTEAFDETVKYTGSLASENNFIAEKYLWNEANLDFKTLYLNDESQFLQAIDANQKQLDSLFNSKKITNEKFITLIKEEDRYANSLKLEDYQEAHKYYSANTEFKTSPGFYDRLKDVNYKDTAAFRNSATYQSLLSTHYNRLAVDKTIENDSLNLSVAYLSMVDSELPDGFAKDKLMSDYLQFGLTPDESLEQVFALYKNSDPNPENLAEITEQYNKLKTIVKGKPSPVFDYENHKGGTTSLKDLGGKYVYIDVWATWCGPCLRELPYLQKIEEKYKGEEIEFVSISIDEAKDFGKWRTMVSEKQLGGIQLLADNNWKSKFVEDYAILGIPRFILIDPQGNIVSADAPRPSDPKLEVIFGEIL